MFGEGRRRASNSDPTLRRILVAHPSAHLYGSDRVMLETVQGLIEDGWQVLVALPGPGPLVAEVLDRGARVVSCSSPVLRKSALRPRGFVQLLAATVRGVVSGTRLLRRARPDVVYVSTLTVPLWIVLARLNGRRALCHVHEAEGSASLPMRRLLALPLFAADTIIANSEFSKRVLGSAFNSLGARTTVIYNGVPGPPSTSSARDQIDGSVRLLYVGRVSERKGVDVAISAVAELEHRGIPAELDVVGAIYPGYEWYERQLVAQVDRLGLTKQVRLCGFETPVWPRLAAADIVLVPSRLDEPFGNTAVEAILAERPLISSDSSGLREAAAGFAAVIQVQPDNPAAIADAVQAMLARWADYCRLASADSLEAARRYAPTGYRAQIVSALARMLRR